jgi:hypothetical protein
MRVGGQLHAPAALPPGKRLRYPFYRRLGGPQGRSGRVRKISPPQGSEPRTVQPVASRYTDYAIPAHKFPPQGSEPRTVQPVASRYTDWAIPAHEFQKASIYTYFHLWENLSVTHCVNGQTASVRTYFIV